MGQRRLIADDLGYHARDQVRVFAQLPILIRVLIKEPNPARNRIARGVVAADDQQNDFPRNSFGSMLRVDGEWASIEMRSLPAVGIDPLVPEPGEVGKALPEHRHLLLVGVDRSAGVDVGGRDVRPVGQGMAILEGKIE